VLIGIDAREICGNATGVGRYLNALLAEWAELPTAQNHRFILFAPRAPREMPPSQFDLQLIAGNGGTRWEQGALARAVNRERPTVFFAPAYSAPLRISSPLVLAMHDVSFAAHPEWFRWPERVRRKWFARQCARKARVVLTLSDHSRREIVHHLGVSPHRVRVIPLGARLPQRATVRRPDVSDPAPEKAISREPLILFVGSIFNRRHLPDLIRAFAQLAPDHPDVRLEIVGENRTHPYQDLDKLVSDLELRQRVRIRSYEPDQVLAELYRRAGVFAFLSEYEGFGLPPLEALASGVPVLLTDTPVAREVFADAAHFVECGNIPATAQALKQLLFETKYREDLLSRASVVLARYSWREAARETLTAIEQAATLDL
jgi:glycosyltransferase involved in cell wall biosynthesis